MAPKLKVFTWSDGFHAFTVAASSRPKALAAWGSKQDLFATGLASELSGGPDYDAALASPGDVIERGLAVDLGKIDKAARPKPSSPSKAWKAKIDRLERELERIDTGYADYVKALDAEAAALEKRRVAIQKTYEITRRKAKSALKTARDRNT